MVQSQPTLTWCSANCAITCPKSGGAVRSWRSWRRRIDPDHLVRCTTSRMAWWSSSVSKFARLEPNHRSSLATEQAKNIKIHSCERRQSPQRRINWFNGHELVVTTSQ